MLTGALIMMGKFLATFRIAKNSLECLMWRKEIIFFVFPFCISAFFVVVAAVVLICYIGSSWSIEILSWKLIVNIPNFVIKHNNKLMHVQDICRIEHEWNAVFWNYSSVRFWFWRTCVGADFFFYFSYDISTFFIRDGIRLDVQWNALFSWAKRRRKKRFWRHKCFMRKLIEIISLECGWS